MPGAIHGDRFAVIRSETRQGDASLRCGFRRSHEPVEARPRTGRRHQIRRHLRRIDHPLAGDVNYDPFKKAKQEEADSLPFHLCDGYQIPNPHPREAWSFLGHRGSGSRIDHVIHTPSVAVTEVEYIDQIGGRHLAGLKSLKPISDHAALRFRVMKNGLHPNSKSAK